MTNAEFLNRNFGTNYKAWMKCGWNYSEDILVWMVNFNGSISSGWENRVTDENTIVEIYVGKPSEQMESYKSVNEKYRFAVDKSKGYKVLGLYKFDTLNSIESKRRVWKRVANSINEFLAN